MPLAIFALWCFFQKVDLDKKSSLYVRKSGDDQLVSKMKLKPMINVSKSISLQRICSNLGIVSKGIC